MAGVRGESSKFSARRVDSIVAPGIGLSWQWPEIEHFWNGVPTFTVVGYESVEIGRKLETGSEYDVQYDDLSKPYYFGVAVSDNAQVRHAYQYKSNELVFQP